MATFPRSMSACVRECFARMDVMDPELRMRLADWLAYHLSNFEFMWPWDKWKHVLDMPPHNSQRCCRIPRLVPGPYKLSINPMHHPSAGGVIASQDQSWRRPKR